MSDQTPSDPSDTPPPPPSWDAPPPPPPAPSYAAAGAQPVPAGTAANSVPDFLAPTWMMNNAPPPPGWAPKQKIVAGLLGILLGWTGAESFYLGNTKKGVIQLVLSLITCGFVGLWGLVEGIMILIGNVKTDAYGQPLTE